jgi:hypothetical protein
MTCFGTTQCCSRCLRFLALAVQLYNSFCLLSAPLSIVTLDKSATRRGTREKAGIVELQRRSTFRGVAVRMVRDGYLIDASHFHCILHPGPGYILADVLFIHPLVASHTHSAARTLGHAAVRSDADKHRDYLADDNCPGYAFCGFPFETFRCHAAPPHSHPLRFPPARV